MYIHETFILKKYYHVLTLLRKIRLEKKKKNTGNQHFFFFSPIVMYPKDTLSHLS